LIQYPHVTDRHRASHPAMLP